MLRLEDIMSAPLVTVTPELPLRAAAELLATHHVSGAPVVRGSRVIGIITAGDILGFQASHSEAARQAGGEDSDEIEWDAEADTDVGFPWAEWEDGGVALVEKLAEHPLDEDALATHTVDDAMTREVLALPAATPLRAGAAFIARHRIHRVLVERDGEIVGVVSTSDLARVVAERGISGEG
ncbi:MAG TPA: CBS domain-containing protein [Gemmatimonadaceae bacterium]|nr:CBS domain-containing protein [Gemmatimonadaceae bacterium]